MPTNSNFNFTNNSVVTLELPFSEHVEELRQRLFLIVGVILLFTCFAFVEVKSLVKILELPINNVKFFQLSPGEYFISTVKISFYTGLLFSSPVAIGQLILFLLPGLTKKETKIILPLLISSLVLFGLGYLYHRFISEQAKYPKRLSLSVSKSVWLTPRKPSNANLSRQSTCKLVWRTTIPKRTSVSLALLSTSIYPIWLGESMLHRRTLTQGLKNWGDEGTRWSILFLIGYAMFQGPSSLSASSEISNIVTKPRLKDFPIWALMTWKSWTNRRNWWRS